MATISGSNQPAVLVAGKVAAVYAAPSVAGAGVAASVPAAAPSSVVGGAQGAIAGANDGGQPTMLGGAAPMQFVAVPGVEAVSQKGAASGAAYVAPDASASAAGGAQWLPGFVPAAAAQPVEGYSLTQLHAMDLQSAGGHAVMSFDGGKTTIEVVGVNHPAGNGTV